MSPMSLLSPESLSQLSSMLTLEGLGGSPLLWNTSLLVLPRDLTDPAVVSGDGEGDRDSFCWRLSRSRWRLLWLSDLEVRNSPPSLLCFPPGLSSVLSWQSLRRKSMNLMLTSDRVTDSDQILFVFFLKICGEIFHGQRLSTPTSLQSLCCQNSTFDNLQLKNFCVTKIK